MAHRDADRSGESQAQRAAANAARSAVIGTLIVLGSVLAAPTLSPMLPTRDVLAVCYGLAWPLVIATRPQVLDRHGSLRIAIFLLTFPLFGLSPLFLVSKYAYADVAAVAVTAWSFGSALAWLGRRFSARP